MPSSRFARSKGGTGTGDGELNQSSRLDALRANVPRAAFTTSQVHLKRDVGSAVGDPEQGALSGLGCKFFLSKSM
jgi:hypothetical protein